MGLFKKKPELEAPDFPDISLKPTKPSVPRPAEPSVPPAPDQSPIKVSESEAQPNDVQPVNWADEALGEHKNLFSYESIKKVEDIDRQIREIDRKLLSL